MTLKAIIIFIFIKLSCSVNGQQISFTVDSIKVYHLPLSLKTRLALDEYEVRHFKTKLANGNEILKVDYEYDSLRLRDFIYTDFANPVYTTESVSKIDVRIVIEVYVEDVVLLKIEMNDRGVYKLGNQKKQRSGNQKLITWVQTYIPEIK